MLIHFSDFLILVGCLGAACLVFDRLLRILERKERDL